MTPVQTLSSHCSCFPIWGPKILGVPRIGVPLHNVEHVNAVSSPFFILHRIIIWCSGSRGEDPKLIEN